MSRKALPPTRIGRRKPNEGPWVTEAMAAVAKHVPSRAWSRNRARQLKRISEAGRRNGRLARAYREMDQERGDG